jgi:hypothetical protein
LKKSHRSLHCSCSFFPTIHTAFGSNRLSAELAKLAACHGSLGLYLQHRPRPEVHHSFCNSSLRSMAQFNLGALDRTAAFRLFKTARKPINQPHAVRASKPSRKPSGQVVKRTAAQPSASAGELTPA